MSLRELCESESMLSDDQKVTVGRASMSLRILRESQRLLSKGEGRERGVGDRRLR